MSEEKLDKILKLLESMDKKIDALSAGGSSVTQGGPSTASASPKKSVNVSGGPQVKEDEKEEGRMKCPSCGSNKFETVEDRKKVISYMGGIAIYGRKHYCRDCSHEWK